MYYLPFMMYWLCFVVLYTSKRMGFVDGLLLSFGILRLITATGRSDFGHLLFSIPELFLIVPYTIAQVRFSEFSRQTMRRFWPYGLGLAFALWFGTRHSILLALVPFIIALALYLRPSPVVKTAKRKIKEVVAANNFVNYNLYALLAGLLLVFAYILAPTYASVVRGIKAEIFVDDSKTPRIGGVKTDAVNYAQIQDIRAAADQYKPKTVFAFPIQPFYYSLAQHHASRFLTFEPQTTVAEQEETISDLKRTKPEVIIFDPLQAHGLSGSLWKISDYITSNYRIAHEVNMRESLWVMVPKEQPARDEKLVFRLFHDNTDATAKTRAVPIQSAVQGLYSAISEQPGRLTFSVDAPQAGELQLSLRDAGGFVPENPVCGTVLIASGKFRTDTRVCSDQGALAIPLPKSVKPLTISLENDSPTPIIWNDVTVK
jgi:hypothetical protein